MKNLHCLFNTEYYNDLDAPQYEAKNDTFCNQTFKPKDTRPLPFTDEDKGYQTIVLCTTYPGLLMGLGYPHGLGTDEGEKNEAIKLGFSLDYTTGLPIIPGSTVKGTLRSFFKLEEAKGFIAEFVGIPKNQVESLEGEIFEGLDSSTEGCETPESALEPTPKPMPKPMPVWKRDVFFDAMPVAADNRKQQLLSLENITPHRKQGNDIPAKLSQKGLKDPQPITLLKVKPGVEFVFRFSLKDGLIGGDKKRELFKEILLINGIGAKTNVGFGSLKPGRCSVFAELTYSESGVPQSTSNIAYSSDVASPEKNIPKIKDTSKKSLETLQKYMNRGHRK